jgi:hypothetical protein
MGGTGKSRNETDRKFEQKQTEGTQEDGEFGHPAGGAIRFRARSEGCRWRSTRLLSGKPPGWRNGLATAGYKYQQDNWFHQAFSNRRKRKLDGNWTDVISSGFGLWFNPGGE